MTKIPSQDGEPIIYFARLVEAKSSQSEPESSADLIGLPQSLGTPALGRNAELPQIQDPSLQLIEGCSINELVARESRLADSISDVTAAGIFPVTGKRTGLPDRADPAEPNELEDPKILSPLQLRQAVEKSADQKHRALFDGPQEAVPDLSSQEAASGTGFQPKRTDSDRTQPSFVAPVDETLAHGLWRKRLKDANSDRIALAKVLAIMILIVGLINMVPALMHWYHSSSALESFGPPRWTYLQIFVAALHLIYALLLFQITDWSSLRAVSVAMLTVAFGYGMLSTALLIGGSNSSVGYFFGVPSMMAGKAAIWSVSMLCLETLIALATGKEANDWRRAEQLLIQIAGKGGTVRLE